MKKTIEFIKNYLPQDMKEAFSDDDLYYILDLIVDYYTRVLSGCTAGDEGISTSIRMRL